MPDFKKTIATVRAKVADAETKAFTARLEAIDAILQGATPYDVMMLAAHALAAVAPRCCEAHQDEFKADFLQMLGEAVEIQQQEQDAAEADADDDAHTSVH
jgi:hypothetical protein